MRNPASETGTATSCAIPITAFLAGVLSVSCWSILGLEKGEMVPPDGYLDSEDEDGVEGTDMDGIDQPAEDLPIDGEGMDVDDDRIHECSTDGDCDDGNLCNGRETCSTESGLCTFTEPLEEGSACGDEPRRICAGGLCAASTCGDGVVDTGGGEFCEPPGEAMCDGDCRLMCEQSEDCIDDGNICNGDEYCDLSTSRCSRRDPLASGEVCQADPRRICVARTCQTSICGDGVFDSEAATPEECDDGNFTNGDGCDNICAYSCHFDTECVDDHDCTDDMCDTEVDHVCVHRVSSASTLCRPASGICDAEELCDGASQDCPADIFAANTRICRAATSDCDAVETCSGTLPNCPPDLYESPGTECDDGNAYTTVDQCDGEGTCLGTPPAGIRYHGLNISAGDNHTCAVAGTRAQCWGNNTYGQLGVGTTDHSEFPLDVVASANEISVIESGYFHSCALTSAGGVKCWGDNSYKHLGDGTDVNRLVPTGVLSLGSGVTQISVGFHHSCARTSTGSVWCWGRNNYGQLGTGSASADGNPAEISGLTGVSAVEAGGYHTCALLATGGVQCWGRNNSGQLGDGRTVDRYTPALVTGLSSGVQAISSFYDHTCALMSTGEIRCWGANGNGQLGDATTTRRTSPVVVSGLSGGREVSAGYNHTCALLGTGAVKCWGRNDFGQLGNRSILDRSSPVDVAGLDVDVASVSAGGYHSCALMNSGEMRCWGKNWNGQLGEGTLGYSADPAQVYGLGAGAVTHVAGGDEHNCAVLASGGAQCWGRNGSGRLGDGTDLDSYRPVPVSELSSNVLGIAAGASHSCAVIENGTDRIVKCWGSNIFGQLGDATTTTSTAPVDVFGITEADMTATGGNHTCSVLSGGTLQCWGSNASGQLGNDSLADSNIPIGSGMAGAARASAGTSHTCAVNAGNTLYCWGENESGQIGDGSTTDRLTPVNIGGLSSPVFSAGQEHTCAFMAPDSLRCWGSNDSGQLGNDSWIDSPNPVVVSGISGTVHDVAAGGSHSCAIVSDLSVMCWGGNTYGQLGDGSLLGSRIPVSVAGLPSGASEVVVGGNHTCALLSDGSVYCWGLNYYGQVGNGTPAFRSVPVYVINGP